MLQIPVWRSTFLSGKERLAAEELLRETENGSIPGMFS